MSEAEKTVIEKPAFWAILPACIRYDKKIPPMARLLYAEISALCDKDGFCHAGNKYFAGVFDVSGHQISRLLHVLKKGNYIDIQIDKREGNTRTMTLNYTKTGVKKPPHLWTKKSIPMDKKVHRVLTKKSIPMDKKVISYMINKEGINKEEINREGEQKNTQTPPPKSVKKSVSKKRERGELKTYGECQNVFLSDEEMEKLRIHIHEKAGLNGNSGQVLLDMIERMSRWQATEGHKPYKDHYLKLKDWFADDLQKGKVFQGSSAYKSQADRNIEIIMNS